MMSARPYSGYAFAAVWAVAIRKTILKNVKSQPLNEQGIAVGAEGMFAIRNTSGHIACVYISQARSFTHFIGKIQLLP